MNPARTIGKVRGRDMALYSCPGPPMGGYYQRTRSPPWQRNCFTETAMFPIGDEDRGPRSGAAIVTIALIVLNVLAFLLELGQGSEGPAVAHHGLGCRAARIQRGSRSAAQHSAALLVDADHIHVLRWMDAWAATCLLCGFSATISTRDGRAVPGVHLRGIAAGCAHRLQRLHDSSVGALAISGVLGSSCSSQNRVRCSPWSIVCSGHRRSRLLDSHPVDQSGRLHCTDVAKAVSR